MPVRSNGDPDDALQAVLRSLGASAREANLARTTVLEAALAALDEGPLASEQRVAAVRAAHQIVGSAGTFGRERSSRLAADLERWFQGDATGQKPDDLEWARTVVAALRADLSRAHQEE